jgi:DNA polymerase-3 subunit delta'
MLEEPPERACLLLISHQPSRLLPTIRSRCRSLRLNRLSVEDIAEVAAASGIETDADSAALAELADGSAGDAIRLTQSGGLPIYREIVGLLGTMPNLDRKRALALADAAAQRGAEEKLDLLFTLIEIALARIARSGATGRAHPEAAPNEAEIFNRLAPNMARARDWADVAQSALARARHGRSVNLDPGALVLDTLFKLQETAA